MMNILWEIVKVLLMVFVIMASVYSVLWCMGYGMAKGALQAWEER